MERDELCGTVLDGRYQLRAPLGTGATAVVFDALSLDDGKRVAVKVLRRSFAYHRDLANRMRREAEVGRSVAHPGIARCWDEGTLPDDGSPYMVMEHIEGESLSQLLARLGSLAVHEALALTRRAAGILHAVHNAGYVHRDVKPEHLLLSADSSGHLRMRLLDFGVCHPIHATAEQRDRDRGRIYGTPGYAAPEQAEGSVDLDGRTDLFGLGATFFEMLTGQAPVDGRNVAIILRRTLERDAPSVKEFVPHVPDDVAQLVAELLCRIPGQRPRNARSVERRVLRLLPGAAWVERELGQRLLSHGQPANVATTLDDVPATAAASAAAH